MKCHMSGLAQYMWCKGIQEKYDEDKEKQAKTDKKKEKMRHRQRTNDKGYVRT